MQACQAADWGAARTATGATCEYSRGWAFFAFDIPLSIQNRDHLHQHVGFVTDPIASFLWVGGQVVQLEEGFGRGYAKGFLGMPWSSFQASSRS